MSNNFFRIIGGFFKNLKASHSVFYLEANIMSVGLLEGINALYAYH